MKLAQTGTGVWIGCYRSRTALLKWVNSMAAGRKKIALFVALSLFLLLPDAGRSDTVIFRHGTRLECKVEGIRPEGLRVNLGSEDKGSLVLDPATVEKIEYDYDSRLDALDEKDYPGHYDLGVWSEDRDMYSQALSRYLYVYGNDADSVPPELYLRIGRMFEKIKPPKPAEAYRAYGLYLEKRPDSAEAQMAMKRLEPKVAGAKPAADDELTDESGLETRAWKWAEWDNRGTIRTVTAAGKRRNIVLEAEYEGGGKDKAPFVLPLNTDLSGSGALVLDLLNPEKKPIRIGVALITGNGYEWYESESRTVPAGEWAIGMRFDLSRKKWKSKETNWRHTTTPQDLNRARTLVLLVYNGRASGKLYADEIHFKEK